MPNLIIKNTPSLSGSALPPGSKSQSVRALLFSLLADGQSTITNYLDSEDTQAAMRVCRALGADVEVRENSLMVISQGLPLKESVIEINTDNSGITTLFTLPLLGLRADCDIPIVLDCGQQMRARPIKPLVDALRNLGMCIEYLQENERLPLLVKGKLKGGSSVVDGINSQYLSALLIGLPCAEHDSVITVRDLHERPYVEMTMGFLQQQNIDYVHQITDNTDTFYIRGKQRYKPMQHKIHGDFSSASYLIAAAVLLPSAVELNGLNYNDSQGDKRLISILQSMGADIVIEHDKIRIHGNKPLKGIRIDANDIPDLLPALAIIATQASDKTEICNVMQARIKETDRIHSMTQGLRRMGVRVEEHEDGITVYPSTLKGAFVEGYGDHRTVMAMAVAGMLATATTIISDGSAISKTYPQFVNTLQKLGANIFFDNLPKQHIILIGFKHVGKTRIGRELAKDLNKKFIDLDKEVEKIYEKKYFKLVTCREIMQKHGESSYRLLESEVLQLALQSKPAVIALGGGTLSSLINQEMIKSQLLLHVVAPHGIVFERIMVDGRPAFFCPNEDPYMSFSRLWNEREAIYNKLTPYKVENSATVQCAVKQAIRHLEAQEVME